MIPAMHSRFAARYALFALFAISASVSQAEVALPPFFSDHMVLQRESKAPIWGTAAPGEEVTVQFRDQTLKTTADAAGKWRVELKGLEAGGPDELTIAGKNAIKLTDVLVGEVWVGSGQSNMAGLVRMYVGNDPILAQIAATAYPTIRGCTAKTGWTVSSPAANANFSAILFAFAVRLQEGINVPVGMMLGAVGGTPSGAWVSNERFNEDAACQALVAEYAKTFDKQLADFHDRVLPVWKKGAEAAKAAGNQVGRTPLPPAPPGTINGKDPGYLYEVHIRPLVGYGMRGVLWDQGESGTAMGGVDQYRMMGALMRGWRADWQAGEFAFLYVQKPSGGGCAWDLNNPVTNKGEKFQLLTEAQLAKTVDGPTLDGSTVETHVRIMTYPNTGMVISSDLGGMTHPVNKSGYGARAAALALGMTYRKPVEYYGPIYKSHAVEGDKVRIQFTHVGKGLAAGHSHKLQGFIIAAADKTFHWADAVIDGDSVVVSSPKVAKPAAVRYGWSVRRPWANLFNQDGLPATSFRTDPW
jgi:sialate O-acetylesterase